MPEPSSVTRIRLRPPAPISTVIFSAPASREFSTSSFTTLAGPLHHFAGGDLVGDLFGKEPDAIHAA